MKLSTVFRILSLNSSTLIVPIEVTIVAVGFSIGDWLLSVLFFTIISVVAVFDVLEFDAVIT